MKLGYGRQWIDDDDIREVTKVLKEDFISQGPKIEEFERAICTYTNAKYCAVLSSGTAALHVATAALDLPKGTKGITSTLTFASTVNAMLHNGIYPVLCDIEASSFLMDLGKFQEKLKKGARLVIPVHFAGLPCDMEKIKSMTESLGSEKIFIIEDAAHALGSTYSSGAKVGSCEYSDMTIFSFHPVKAITTGEGGAITTNDEELYKRIIALRNHGFVKNSDGINEMKYLGYNFRMTDFQAVLGTSQLKKIDGFVDRRREIAERYREKLSKIPFLRFQSSPLEKNSSLHIMVMLIEFEGAGVDKKTFRERLRERGIITQIHYLPIHMHEYYKNKLGHRTGDFPISEDYYKKALTIPLYPKMTDEEADYVVNEIINTLKLKLVL